MNIDHPTLQHMGQLRSLWKEAFGDSDDFLDIFFSTGFAPQRCMCAFDGETVVSVAYWFSCESFAYIYAVATAKSHQGRGICHQLMRAIHDKLNDMGFAGAILVPGEENLRKFYAGMGYENCGGIRQWQCQAAAVPIPLRQIDGAEFSALRRKFLPEGSVTQEGENLAYLSQLANFYAGADFLLTAAMDGDILQAVELLGNPNAAAGITAALGAKTGNFRGPGCAPFAMCKLFVEEKMPTYFGFAFD